MELFLIRRKHSPLIAANNKGTFRKRVFTKDEKMVETLGQANLYILYYVFVW